MNNTEIIKTLCETSESLTAVFKLAEVLDTAIMFADQRNDKNISGSCAGVAEMIGDMVLKNIEKIDEICEMIS